MPNHFIEKNKLQYFIIIDKQFIDDMLEGTIMNQIHILNQNKDQDFSQVNKDWGDNIINENDDINKGIIQFEIEEDEKQFQDCNQNVLRNY